MDKWSAKKALRKLFEIGQRFGFDLLPRHFYSEIPGIKELKSTTDWRRAYTMSGVQGADTSSQLAFVAECCAGEMLQRQKTGNFYESACRDNGAAGFGPIEADFLASFIYAKRPKKIIQIGSGVSTAVILRASEAAGYRPLIECVDPYPTRFLSKAAEKGLIRLTVEKAERVEFGVLADLSGNDLFFVDSTHTLRPGGEVPRIVLEVLPRLKRDVWVHFHDVYFPYDYCRGILDQDLFFPHESVLLHAFLAQNPRYAIRASLSMLHYAHPDQLVKYLPNYKPAGNADGLAASEGHFPSSLYLQTTSNAAANDV